MAAAEAAPPVAAPDLVASLFYNIMSAPCFDVLKSDPGAFLSSPCAAQSLSKLLGYGIVLGAAILKVPQILAVVKKRSGAGVPSVGVWLETIGFVIVAAYGMRKEFPFSTYGEAFIILVQNLVLLFLLALYGGFLSSFAVVSLALGAFSFVALPLPAGIGAPEPLLPLEWLTSLQAINIVIFSSSKLPFIYAAFRDGSTGSLAVITVFLQFIGSLARVFTTLQEVDDAWVLIGYYIGSALSGLMLLQIFMYWGKAAPGTAAAISKKKKKNK